MALREDEKTNRWKKQDICIGSTKACAFPAMIRSYSKFIISFAEDEAGELYFMSTSYPSAYAPHGSLYKLVDPARRAPPGKCKYKPVTVKIKSKRIAFVPRAKTVLEFLNEPPPTKPPKRSSTLPGAAPTAAAKKSKKMASSKVKASTVKPALSNKKTPKTKAGGEHHRPKQKGARVPRTTPAPSLARRKSSQLTGAKKLLTEKAAQAKGTPGRRRKESR